MTDIHSHLLYGMDQGPSSIDEAAKMVCEAEEAGIDTIYATPHYSGDSACTDDAGRFFEKLSCSISGSGITLIPGYEVVADPMIIDGSTDLKKLTLGSSPHMLVRFQPDVLPAFVYDFTDALQEREIIPVLAHPERNTCFLKNPGLLEGLSRRGCMQQIDAASILGLHGDRVRSLARFLVLSNTADFVASNARSVSGYADWYQKAYRTVCCWVGENKAGRFFHGQFYSGSVKRPVSIHSCFSTDQKSQARPLSTYS